MAVRAAVAVMCAGLISSCATVQQVSLVTRPSKNPEVLAAVERFYLASSLTELRAALDAAVAADENSPLTHEIQARFAQLQGREKDVARHLMLAVQNTHDDSALLHLHQLMSLDFTFDERPLVEALLQALVDTHPDADVRALAAYHFATFLNVDGDLRERDEVIKNLTGRLQFAFVGTWDNDSGKGFDAELAPELRSSLDEKYDGRFGSLSWRRDVPTDPRGRYDLASVMSPTRFAAAFGQSQFEVKTAGRYALKLFSTDPLKVWVDGKLQFSAAEIDRVVLDHLIIPLELKAGKHTVLIKSAHKEGPWFLMARVTPFADEVKFTTVDQMAQWRVAQLKTSPARAANLLVSWLHFSIGGAAAVKAADATVKRFPDSVLAALWQVDALWFNQERGRTADALGSLDKKFGEELPFIRLRQTRFQMQQGLKQKARETLLTMAKEHPDLREVHEQLIDVYRSEGWVEDELQTLRLIQKQFGSTQDSLGDYARTLLRAGYRDDAVKVYESVLQVTPFHPDTMKRVAELATEAGDWDKAETLYERRLASWPVDTTAWLSLAEVRRRSGRDADALKALAQAQALSPDSSAPYIKRGDLAYAHQETQQALNNWRLALERNPENEALANRIEYLSPENRGPWLADAPDEAALNAVVAQRKGLKQLPGADHAYLLDHEVTLLNHDGSTSNVVTLIAHAFNAQGRDRLMRQSIPGGRLRVLHSYSVDEKGLRSEASSERGRQIFFRGLQPGATLVLQYRLDVPPSGYLSRYLTQTWSFQSVADQRRESTYIVWAPLGTQFHEERVGDIKRSEEKRGDQMRVVWTAGNTTPVVAEPSMPTLGEVAANIRLSTVPDWKTWLSWEQALLEGVFRDSPEIDALAKQLEAGATSNDEKLKRIHQFVMEEIRYQQDYENFLAGVKPHPAPMVLERKYGDCKDKAVLFIELARKLGLNAQFALVRTRDAGPVNTDVPMQQFNHAIVYVPEQPNVTSRFFDPTAELLDLDAQRTDDVGTQSLVFDPTTGVHTWREIPYQAPESNAEHTSLALQLDEKGGATGTLRLESVGRSGSLIRRVSRNQAMFEQVAQRVAAVLLPNVTATAPEAVETHSLTAPAVIGMKVSASSLARAEGTSLRMKIPTDWNPRNLFNLATRQHALVLGAPAKYSTHIELAVPAGFEISKLPASGTIELPCMAVRREVKREDNRIVTDQSYVLKCERLSANEYGKYRARVEEMSKLLDDELVLGPAAPVKVKATKQPKR